MQIGKAVNNKCHGTQSQQYLYLHPSPNQPANPPLMADPLNPATYPSIPGGMNQLQIFGRHYFQTYSQSTSEPIETNNSDRCIALITHSDGFFEPSYHLSGSTQGAHRTRNLGSSGRCKESKASVFADIRLTSRLLRHP